MNLKQATYIRTIAEEGSITTAAKKLYISQPSLSQMLRQVEAEIGLPLFDRSTSPLRLTYAGEKYLETANDIINANERLEIQLQQIRQQDSGKLRFGISTQRGMQVLPAVIPLFRKEYPLVELELQEGGSADLEERLLTGQVDLVLAATQPTNAHLSYQLIEQEVIGVLAGAGSPLANTYKSGMPISIEETVGNTFISMSKGHSLRLAQDRLFRRIGFDAPILLETNSLEIAKRTTLSSGVCMLCSNIFIDDYVRNANGAFYPLANYENHRHFYACFRNEDQLPNYTKRFIQIVKDTLDLQKIR